MLSSNGCATECRPTMPLIPHMSENLPPRECCNSVTNHVNEARHHTQAVETLTADGSDRAAIRREGQFLAEIVKCFSSGFSRRRIDSWTLVVVGSNTRRAPAGTLGTEIEVSGPGEPAERTERCTPHDSSSGPARSWGCCSLLRQCSRAPSTSIRSAAAT